MSEWNEIGPDDNPEDVPALQEMLEEWLIDVRAQIDEGLRGEGLSFAERERVIKLGLKKAAALYWQKQADVIAQARGGRPPIH
jgi:hypothetical protein